jgi:hypothetical protein
MEKYQIKVSNNKIVIITGGQYIIQKIFAVNIINHIILPEGIVILLDPDGGDPNKSFRNLLLLGYDANIIWEAVLPSTAGVDCYITVKLLDNQIIGHTWNGDVCTIDKKNGSVISSYWTK